MKIGVVTFPGSNCEADAVHAGHVMGFDVVRLWHKDTTLPADIDLVILPGGFSYGDYLRTGAIARFSPVMTSVIRFAQGGGYVMGICNGFQILTEAGLLPGALISNAQQRFVCKDTFLRVENTATPYSCALSAGAVLRIPVAHGEGRFIAPADVIERIEKDGRVVFRYCTNGGEITPEANPNGSINNIAGIVNEAGNVMGMMPHPERYVEARVGGMDGRGVFASIAHHVEQIMAQSVA